MAAIYKTLIQTSLSGSSQRVALGLSAVPNATANAENDVEEVRSIIRNLKADEDSLRTSLETSREAIREWSNLVKATPAAQRVDASQDFSDFEATHDVTEKMATLQTFLYELRRRTYDLEVFGRLRQAAIPPPAVFVNIKSKVLGAQGDCVTLIVCVAA